MKKSFLCITASIVLGTMMLFQACKEDDENTQTGNLKIELLTPDASAYVVAPDDLPLAFTWKKTAGTGATTLYISTDETFPEGDKTLKHEAGDALAYSLDATAYDALLAAGGVDYGSPANVYWKVTADGATPDTRSFTAYRAPEPPPPTITLTPVEGTLNATTLEAGPTFTWSTVTEVTAYKIKFDTEGSFTSVNTATYDAGNGAYTFASPATFDDMLEAVGVSAQGTVYWTVAPEPANTAVVLANSPGSFTAVRLTQLIAPTYDEKAIAPADLTGNFTLTWKAVQGATGYEVTIARDEGLSEITSLSTTNVPTNTLTFTWSDIQNLIDDPANNFKRYKKNVLYWNVKATGEANYIAEAPGRFNLYGRRIFVDNRAALAHAEYDKVGWWPPEKATPIYTEPVQTYPVAVLEYNDKEVVWLAEDLRAMAWFSPFMGVPNTRPIEATYYVAGDEACATGNLPANYLNRTDPPVGKYYDAAYMHDMVPRGSTWDDRVWRVPKEDDWRAMFGAALAIDESLNILRHPNFCAGECGAHVNEWGMNMVANGGFVYGGDCAGGATRYEWSENWFFYLCEIPADNGEPSGNAIMWYGSDGFVNGARNGNNIRAIYTGDGE